MAYRPIAELKEALSDYEKANAKRIKNNTLEYTKEDGTRVIRLHDTDIIFFLPNGNVRYNSGGWRTVTTKQRMNEYGNAQLYQEKGIWYVMTQQKILDTFPKDKHAEFQAQESAKSWKAEGYKVWIQRPGWSLSSDEYVVRGHIPVVFYDGITLRADGSVSPRNAKTGQAEAKNIKRKLKLIDAYCKKLRDLMTDKELPMPSGGDCWHCSMRTEDGKTLGELSKSDHLEKHLKEKYVHGSLVMNALNAMGFNIGFYFQAIWGSGSWFDPTENVVRAVRRYFKRELGIGY